MKRYAIGLLCLAFVLVGCDILLPRVGDKGEPCADNGACDEGLVCNFGDCTSPRDLDEKCDDSWILDQEWDESDSQWLDAYFTCEEDLCCDHGRCVDDSEWVPQLESDLLWNRCPNGSRWKKCHCDAVPFYYIGWYHNKDYEFDGFCDDPMRLPTLNEVISMLGGCDSSVLNGHEGQCNSCAQSDTCSSMFTFVGYETSTMRLITSDFHLDIYDYVTSIWTVDLDNGNVEKDWITNNFEFNDLEFIVLCVK